MAFCQALKYEPGVRLPGSQQASSEVMNMGPEHLSKLTVDIVNIQSLFGLFLVD